jgi:rhomboid family GlyGly-CTERM serine protease
MSPPFLMINLPLQTKYIVSPLLLMLISSMFYLFEPTSNDYFRYDLTLIQNAQYWRLLSGNFLHTNFIHLLLNSAGVIFIWLLHAEHYTPKRYFSILLLCCLGCGVGLYFFSPLQQYVGLSGALHGVIAYGAIKDIEVKMKTGWLLLAGIIIKVAYENIAGASDSVKALIDANVAVEAHLFGLASGLLLATPIMLQIAKSKMAISSKSKQA